MLGADCTSKLKRRIAYREAGFNGKTGRELAQSVGRQEILDALEAAGDADAIQCRCGSRLPWKQCHAGDPGEPAFFTTVGRCWRFSPTARCPCGLTSKKHYDCCWTLIRGYYQESDGNCIHRLKDRSVLPACAQIIDKSPSEAGELIRSPEVWQEFISYSRASFRGSKLPTMVPTSTLDVSNNWMLAISSFSMQIHGQWMRKLFCSTSEDGTKPSLLSAMIAIWLAPNETPCLKEHKASACTPCWFPIAWTGVIRQVLGRTKGRLIDRFILVGQQNCGERERGEHPWESTWELLVLTLPVVASLIVPTLEYRKCSKCKSIAYCPTDCQRQDWKCHKLQCRVESGSVERTIASS